MVLSSSLVVAVANLSADVCQYAACNPERFPSDTVLRLLFCLPLLHLRRLAVSLWSYISSSPRSDDRHSD